MSAKWTWIFGIAGGISLLLTLYLYLAAQTVTERDWFVFGIGVLVGAMLAAFMATFIFHGDSRAKRLAQDGTPLPARSERIEALKDEYTQVHIKIAEAVSKAESARYNAAEASNMRWGGMAADELGNSTQWKLVERRLKEKAADIQSTIKCLDDQTDAEYLREQKRGPPRRK